MSDKNYLPWWRLDNAAKIFPSTSSAHDSKVFRFFCELKEDVDPAALQAALDKTMEMFPIWRRALCPPWPARMSCSHAFPSTPLPSAACFSVCSTTGGASVWRYTMSSPTGPGRWIFCGSLCMSTSASGTQMISSP